MEYIQVFGVVGTLEHLDCGSSISTILSHVIENIHNQKLANYVSTCMCIADCSVPLCSIKTVDLIKMLKFLNGNTKLRYMYPI